MNKRFLVLITLFCFNASSLCAQQEESRKIRNFKHNVGFAAGHPIGFAPSYLASIKNMRFQFAFLPDVDSRITRLSSSICFMYQISNYDEVNILVFQSNAYEHVGKRKPIYLLHETSDLRHAMGIGFEIKALEQFSIICLGGYRIYDNYSSVSLNLEGGLFYNL